MSRLTSNTSVVIENQEYHLDELVRVNMFDPAGPRFWSVCFFILHIGLDNITIKCTYNKGDLRTLLVKDDRFVDQRFSFEKLT